MRHITRIRIRGFQSHADTELHLAPGLNAITGPSDNGKSAIIRALRWALWNQAPEGEWIRKGCTVAAVEVEMSDGTVITRERRSGRNRYTITLPGAEPLVLADFGRDVPQEVLRAHGMLPVDFDADHATMLNLASQLEAPFFLSDPAPQRARILGRLAGVHVIDVAIRGSNRDLQAIARETKAQEAEVTRLTAALEAYADLPEQEAMVDRAEDLLAQITAMVDRLSRLTAAAARYRDVRGAMAATGATLHRLRGVEAADARRTEAETVHLRHGRLAVIRDELSAAQAAIRQTGAVLDRFARLPEAAVALAQAEAAEARRVQLHRARAQAQVIRAAGRETEAILRRTGGAEAAGALLAEAADRTARLDRLASIRQSLTTTRMALSRTVAAQEVAEVRAGADVPLGRVTALQDRLVALRSAKSLLTETHARQERGRQVLSDLTTRIQAAGAAYGQALQSAGVCPTCLQRIDPITAAQIAATLTEEECEHEHHHVA